MLKGMKICIVGAGVAGITAGHLLAEQGIDFDILEAHSTHGGRLKKLEGFADFPIDLGAEWIHIWAKARPLLVKDILEGVDTQHKTFEYKP